jgi:predicted transcriptional regulator
LKLEYCGTILALAITSDNKYVVFGGYDKNVNIVDLQNQTREAILQGHFD